MESRGNAVGVYLLSPTICQLLV